MMLKPDFPVNWNISQTELFVQNANGSVWKCCRNGNQPVIIKEFQSDDKTEETSGLDYLIWRDGEASVRILAQSSNLVMMEYAGEQSLHDLVKDNNDQKATLIAADLLSKLHHKPVDPFPDKFIPLTKWFSALFIKANSSSSSPWSDFYQSGAQLALNLMAQAKILQPLHGDIHHDNILKSARGWLTIDPKGLYGDAAYDAANLFYNPLQYTTQCLDTDRIHFMADEFSKALGKPKQLILDYAIAYGCLSASWFAEDGNDADEQRQLQIANHIQIVRDQLRTEISTFCTTPVSDTKC